MEILSFIRNLFRPDNHSDWREHNGEMRRWVDGAWQYRPMTDAEKFEEWDARQY